MRHQTAMQRERLTALHSRDLTAIAASAASWATWRAQDGLTLISEERDLLALLQLRGILPSDVVALLEARPDWRGSR